MIDGIWVPICVEMGGHVFPPEFFKSISIALKEGKYKVREDGGFYKLDDTGRTNHIDFIGGKPPTEGRTLRGIFKRSGATLMICCDPDGKTRPQEFKTSTGARFMLVTCEPHQK
jgi:uncharacterized protein (TIGR03067 family)